MNTHTKSRPILKNRLERLNNESEMLANKHQKYNVWFTRIIITLMLISIIYFLVDLL
jgi:hypothetical protein